MIRIAITGPESTGKSWLCEALAEHYQAVLVPEYAREYLNHLKTPYTRDDVINIAHIQHEMIMDAAEQQASSFMIADTELLVISIWLEHKYGNSDPFVERQLRLQPFDLYLLCDIDLPWEEDPLREHPHQREVLLNKYKTRLDQLEVRYTLVRGTGTQRLRNAIAAIQQTL
jgi:nicotinamide riboside kinase